MEKTDAYMGHEADHQELVRNKRKSDPSRDVRIRAAWLYFVEGKTQQETAEQLGLNRVQVTRLIADAKKRGEVDIRINAEISSILELERGLETKFDIGQVIVAPLSAEDTDPTKAIATLGGQFISDFVQSDMTIGVGWGRTLYSALPHIRGRDLNSVRVISLLGGISQAKRFNPAEFAWQFAELFQGEGYLVPAPALVDSEETKHALLERCGINQIFEQADKLDVAFLSAGGIEGITTSYRLGHLSEAERLSLVEAGAVGDLLYNFISEDGTLVDHNVNTRGISIGLDRLKRAKERVLISGGAEKVKVLLGCVRLVKPTVFITDEFTAQKMLQSE
ncbi:MAG: sugar-binding transcriptional regulator [Pseudomonadota bacterium]